jgi:putative ABC transport system permease protein
MANLLQDFRYGLRMLARSPSFTAIAILTLALGIGANTAIFSVVNSTLLGPLPFKDASELVNLHARATFFDFWNLGLSLPDVNDVRAQSQSFAAVVPYDYATVDLIGRDTPRQLNAAKVPADFFAMLGLKPLIGRTFLPSETQPGADREAILSGTLWKSQFGSDPNVVGKSITLDGKPYRVVGVMPEMRQMFSPAAMDIWVPFAPSPADLADRGMHGTPVMARLKPGVTIQQAQAELDGIAARLAKAYLKDDKNWGFRVDSLRRDMNRETQTPLLILFGAVGFVLLIACANVGNLFLSRGWARRRELSIRSTLGATRGRLIRQLLAESTLLALAGGACGLLLTFWVVDTLKAKTMAGSAFVFTEGIVIDTRVLLFTLAASMLAGILFGLAPAYLSSRHDLSRAMKESGAGAQAGASSSGHNPLRQLLVVTEVALALVLVIGATLALRSFARMLRVNLGFDTEHILDMRLDFPATKFKNPEEMFAYVRTLTDRLRATPGVESAAAAGCGPLSSSHGEGMFEIEGIPENPKVQMTAGVTDVGPGYFETLGIPLLRGRDFRVLDSGGSAPVMIVSHAFAQAFLSGRNPIGHRIYMGDEDAQHHKIWKEIVGEVADIHDRSPRIPVSPMIYTSFYKGDFTVGMIIGVDLLMRTRGNPQAMISKAQRQVWALDRSEPVSSIQTMQQRLALSVALPRFQSLLLGAFGALGLILAVIGIYGVISYSVTQRTHEIGIRMALGAEPGQVMRLILRQGFWLVVAGVGIGLLTSLALTRLMRTLLFGVSATDPLTFAGVAVLLIIVALTACYVPARRAMRVDPMVALRYE